MNLRWFCVVVTALLVFTPTSGDAQTGEFATKAKRAILMDAASGSIMFQQAADELAPPASMTKLMTLAVLFRALKESKVSLETEFKTSEHAWRTGGAPSRTSAMFIPINNMTRIDELIQGIVVQSGNDAAITVAEGLGKTEAQFAKMMDDEARRLGMPKSTFRNATGLDAEGHVMTARELAVLARHLIQDYPDRYPVFAQKEMAYRKHKFYNRNPLLSADLGVDGLKTGNTDAAGYGMVVSAVNRGRRLIGVVMGLADERERQSEMRRLLEWGFRSFDEAKLFEPNETVAWARVWGGSQMYVPLTNKDGVRVVLPKYPPAQKLRGEIVYNGPLKPPIRKGDEVATFRVTTSSNASGEAPLYAAEDIEEGGFVRRGLDSLMILALRKVGL